jgi:hypothetical protein
MIGDQREFEPEDFVHDAIDDLPVPESPIWNSVHAWMAEAAFVYLF